MQLKDGFKKVLLELMMEKGISTIIPVTKSSAADNFEKHAGKVGAHTFYCITDSERKSLHLHDS